MWFEYWLRRGLEINIVSCCCDAALRMCMRFVSVESMYVCLCVCVGAYFMDVLQLQSCAVI